jgi:hypothetical protein
MYLLKLFKRGQGSPPTPSSPMKKKKKNVLMNQSSHDPTDSDSGMIRSNRRVINNYLRRIGRRSNQELSLDSQGFAYLPFKKFLIIVEVPEDEPELCYFFTMVFELNLKSSKILTIPQLNHLEIDTRGSTLSLDEQEVNLCFSTRVAGLNYNKMVNCMEDFMQTAVDANTTLGAALRVANNVQIHD